MKTLILSLSFFLLGLSSYSQNWSLINPNRTVFFQHSDSTHITNTIVIDSTEVNGANTDYYSAYAFKYCDTCQGFSYSQPIIYRYAKEFLGFNIEDDIINNQFNLDENTIKQHSSVNDTWTFSIGITATTIGIAEVSIFGVLDSTKTFELSNSDTIIISKNHGVIRYPDFENIGKYYEFVGFHEGQNSYGDYLPNAFTTYDFNINDVFCYYKEFWNVGDISENNQQITILNKFINQDTTILTVKSLSVNHYYDAIDYYYDYYSDGNYTVTYKYYTGEGSIENVFGKQESIVPPYFNNMVNNYGGFTNIYASQYINSEFGPVKKIYNCNLYNDSLLTTFPEEIYLDGSFIQYFGNNIGKTKYNKSWFEMINFGYLTGTIISGDTTGTIYNYPDDLGFEEQTTKKQLNIYPNPATEQITIPAGITNLKIFSNVGELVLEIEDPNSMIDVSLLSKGLYFIVGEDADSNLLTSKLIIQ